jgi:hypothetical protein
MEGTMSGDPCQFILDEYISATKEYSETHDKLRRLFNEVSEGHELSEVLNGGVSRAINQEVEAHERFVNAARDLMYSKIVFKSKIPS